MVFSAIFVAVAARFRMMLLVSQSVVSRGLQFLNNSLHLIVARSRKHGVLGVTVQVPEVVEAGQNDLENADLCVRVRVRALFPRLLRRTSGPGSFRSHHVLVEPARSAQALACLGGKIGRRSLVSGIVSGVRRAKDGLIPPVLPGGDFQ